MNSELIERVARAIYRASMWAEGDPDAVTLDQETLLVRGEGALEWERFIPEARAAIAAMREPTDAMIDAAAETPGMRAANSAMQLHQARGYGFDGGAFEAGSPLRQAWRAMIDAASEPPVIEEIRK